MTTTFIPTDGDIALLLRTILRHTNISPSALQKAIERQLPRNDDYASVLAAAREQGLLDENDSAAEIKLSDAGNRWITEQSAELSVEEEENDNLGTADAPKEPYDVAKLNMEARPFSVFQALRKIEKGEINLSPDFQRAFVWDTVRQSRLIESILIRIPLPAFYLDAADQVHWNVVDGLQRLTTIHNYCRKETFALEGLQFLRELEGKKFNELPAQYQVLIEDQTTFQFYILTPGTPAQAKFTIFSRVNTGGMQLTPQEIRHALDQGKATILLKEIAEDSTFRKITGGLVETLRMSDRELILRALAFMHLGTAKYAEFNGQDAFLNYALAELNKQGEAYLQKLKQVFLDSIDKVHQVFGRYAFRKFTAVGGRRNPFNKALFEVWTTAVRHYPLETLLQEKRRILESFAKLNQGVQGSEFTRSISSNTSGNSAVMARFLYIEELLKDVCDAKKIQIDGYKCLRQSKPMQITNLNILVGANGVGKSSVLQALLLLRQSADQGGLVERLNLSGQLYEAGTATDALHPAAKQQIQINLGAEQHNYHALFEYSREEDSARLLNAKIPGNLPSCLYQRGNAFAYINAERIGPRVTNILPTDDNNISGLVGKYGEHTAALLARQGKQPYSTGGWPKPDEDKSKRKQTEEFALGEKKPLPPIAQKLISAARTLDQLDIASTVENSGGRLDLLADAMLGWIIPGATFGAHEETHTDAARLEFFYRSGNIKTAVRATHTGFGLSYTLPIITAALALREGGLLLIENPEAHLHPFSQSRIGAFLAVMAGGGRQIFLETHSDHVVNGIRLAIRHQLISPEAVVFNYFQRRPNDDTAEVIQIRPDAKGLLEQWPVGFFDQIEDDLSRL